MCLARKAAPKYGQPQASDDVEVLEAADATVLAKAWATSENRPKDGQ